MEVFPRAGVARATALQNCVAAVGLSAFLLTCAACRPAPSGRIDASPIVGTWLVKAPEAPFPLHMFIFHADGTVLQSNPDAGDPNTSDSSAMGVWLPDADRIKGKIVETMADRTTRKFVSRGEISFSIKVDGDAFTGSASANFYDLEGKRLRGPVSATLQGQRILP